MTMCASITQVRTVAAGETVGYGRTWRAGRPTRIATVAAGYGDGVFRALSNRGEVIVAGERRPMVGRVSMDQISVDLGDAPAQAGDEAVLFGMRDSVRLDAAEVAAMIGTIPHEVTCAVSARVPRVVVGESIDRVAQPRMA
jgi:alanine racemase